MKRLDGVSAALTAMLSVAGCADSDNPTALADLDPVTAFEIASADVETMHAVEITARVQEGGRPMRLRDAQIEVQPPTGPTRLVGLTEDERGYSAYVRFYESGEHHLHLLGQPERHYLMREMGEVEIDVERQHQILGDHRFEVSVSPAPIVAGLPARVTLHGWQIAPDGTLDQEAQGLQLHATLHTPDGIEVPLEPAEAGPGQYRMDLAFPAAGSYELSVGIEEDGGGAHVPSDDPHGDEHDSGMHFGIHVPSPGDAAGEAPVTEGGHHDHGH